MLHRIVILSALSIQIVNRIRHVLLKDVEIHVKVLVDLELNVAYTTTFLFVVAPLDILVIHSYNARK